MTIPVRLQLSRRAGFKLDVASRAANGLPARKVDRTTPFGNQFVVRRIDPSARLDIVRRHRRWLFGSSAQAARLRERIARELVGTNIACWCPTGEGTICHADAIIDVIVAAGRLKNKKGSSNGQRQ